MSSELFGNFRCFFFVFFKVQLMILGQFLVGINVCSCTLDVTLSTTVCTLQSRKTKFTTFFFLPWNEINLRWEQSYPFRGYTIPNVYEHTVAFFFFIYINLHQMNRNIQLIKTVTWPDRRFSNSNGHRFLHSSVLQRPLPRAERLHQRKKNSTSQQ